MNAFWDKNKWDLSSENEYGLESRLKYSYSTDKFVSYFSFFVNIFKENKTYMSQLEGKMT